jgi:hypothetical protein
MHRQGGRGGLGWISLAMCRERYDTGCVRSKATKTLFRTREETWLCDCHASVRAREISRTGREQRPERSSRWQSSLLLRLIPQTIGIVEPLLFGEQQGFEFFAFLGVTRIVGQVDLFRHGVATG